MCLIAFAYKVHPDYPLILIGNRDELHARPTLALAKWTDTPGVFGGRDLSAGGSWLALSRGGRLAAVTNFRESTTVAAPRSRGELVKAFVSGSLSAVSFAEMTRVRHEEYGAFNLLCWDGEELIHTTNRPKPYWASVEPGIHGLSNGVIDAPWPKVSLATSALRSWLAATPLTVDRNIQDPNVDPLFTALANRDIAPDVELPDTGVGIEVERRLSPAFICGETYGTRASSVVLISRSGGALFVERGFGPGGVALGEQRVGC